MKARITLLFTLLVLLLAAPLHAQVITVKSLTLGATKFTPAQATPSGHLFYGEWGAKESLTIELETANRKDKTVTFGLTGFNASDPLNENSFDIVYRNQPLTKGKDLQIQVAQNLNMSKGPLTVYISQDGIIREYYTFVEKQKPLPVTLLSFTAKVEQDNVRLRWTVTEVRFHDHYEIERSFNGISFELIGTTTDQSLVDHSATGLCYYRLVQVDLDGSRNYGPIVSVNAHDHELDVYLLNGEHLGTYKRLSDIPRRGYLFINRQALYLQP